MTPTPTRDESTRSPRTQAQRSAASRALLLEAGVDLIKEVGYTSMTLAEVARRAELSLGALQHHFRSKEELVLAVHEHVVALYRKPYEILAAEELPVAQRCDRLAELLVQYFLSRESIVLGAIWTGTRGEPSLHARIRAQYDRLVEDDIKGWEALFVDVQTTPREVRHARMLIVSACRGFLMQQLLRPSRGDREKFVAILKELARAAFIHHSLAIKS